MEAYLKEQYDVFEDERYLTQESDIEEYFKDAGSDFLDCGQGYYQDEADIICKVSDKYYKVKIKASIVGEKQDIGDRLYFVDDIKSVVYEGINPKIKYLLHIIWKLQMIKKEPWRTIWRIFLLNFKTK